MVQASRLATVMARRQKQVLAACLALAIISAFDGAEAAKKRSKGKKKVAKLEPLKCGVCSAIVEVVREEVHKKENDTSTLDLRWGLTAEVKEGKARRLGKVIPYKRSELLATEISSCALSPDTTFPTSTQRCVCVCVCVTQRERERETDRQTECGLMHA